MPRTPWGLVVFAVLAMLAVVALAHPAQPEPATAPAPVAGATPKPKPSPKFHYTSREPVIGAYITTKGTPRAERDGWATGPTSTETIWYANGEETDALLISSTATVTRIVWVLPDGSQRVQVGDLTYYNPETGVYE